MLHSVDQYFPSDQDMILQNRAWMKEPFKVQDRPLDFTVIKYKKSTHMVSASQLQLTFKETTIRQLGDKINEEYPQFSK